MRVHLYIRVSTEQQAEKGYSIPTQIEACEKKALELGATELVHHIDDGYSGATIDRPALSDLRQAVRDKLVDSIVCYDPDRLARDQFIQLLLMKEFEKARVKVAFVSVNYEDTRTGKLLFSLLAAVAEYERQTIKERTLRGKRGKAKSGKIVMNNHPTGYDFDSEHSMYVPNQEAELVRSLFRMAAEGNSISSIVRQLNREKVPGPKGKLWHAGTVSRILRNPMYRGEAIQFKESREKVDGKWVTKRRDQSDWIIVPCPSLVSQDVFDAAQASIAENQRFSPRNTQHHYLLQHIARCGICGRSMMIAQRGKGVDYYVCASHRMYSDTGQGHCGSRGIKVDLLDETVWEYLLDLVKDPNKLRKMLASKSAPTPSAQTLSELRKQETDIEERRKKTMSFFSKGKIDAQSADEALTEIKKNLDDVRKRIQNITRVNNIKSVDDRFREFMAVMQNPEDRRDACRDALDAVYITRTDNNKGRYAKAELDVRIVLK